MNVLRHFVKLLAGLLVLVYLGVSYDAFAAIAPNKGQANIEVLAGNKTVAFNTVHYQSAKKRFYHPQSLVSRLYQILSNPVHTNSQCYTVFRVQQEIAQEHQAKRLKIFLHTRFQQASYRS